MKLSDVKLARWCGANSPVPALVENDIPVPMSPEQLEEALKLAMMEVERLREAMAAVASSPGSNWLSGQLALGEALDGCMGENLYHAIQVVRAAEAAKEKADG